MDPNVTFERIKQKYEAKRVPERLESQDRRLHKGDCRNNKQNSNCLETQIKWNWKFWAALN